MLQAKSILDPFAGWGERCLASMVTNINYTGIDSNPNLIVPYQQLVQTYEHSNNITIISKKIQDVDLTKIEFDVVFSSPPFWTDKGKLQEVYTNCDTEYKIFMENVLAKFVQTCLLRPGVKVGLHLPINMYEDLEAIIGPCYDTIQFKTIKINTVYVWKSQV